jgi:hypothetical protein
MSSQVSLRHDGHGHASARAICPGRQHKRFLPTPEKSPQRPARAFALLLPNSKDIPAFASTPRSRTSARRECHEDRANRFSFMRSLPVRPKILRDGPLIDQSFAASPAESGRSWEGYGPSSHRDLLAASPAAHQMALPNRPKRGCWATRRVGWPILPLAMVLRFRCGFSSLLGSAAWS